MLINLVIAGELFLVFTFVLGLIKTRTRITIALISLFFPVLIQVQGKDALTTGTIFVLMVYLAHIREEKVVSEKYDLWIYLAMLLGILSIASDWQQLGGLKQAGPALRNFLNFFSSMLLFLVIKNSSKARHEEESEDWIEKILSLLVLLIAFHVLLSIGVKFSPGLKVLYTPFLSRTSDAFEIAKRVEIQRISSFVFTPEGYGEILAVMSPFIIYKIYKFKRMLWLLCFGVFALGLLFTVTRSGILLFLAGTILSVLYHERHRLGKTVIPAYMAISALFAVAVLKPDIFGDVVLRFSAAAQTYSSTGNVIDAINRGSVFRYAWDTVVHSLNFFGNGFMGTEVHFHNLALTILYQRGIIGTIIFFIVLLYPTAGLIKAMKSTTDDNKPLIVACLLSMALFTTNEMKFEFTRYSSYQQICWVVIAIYYLSSKNVLERKKPYPGNVSASSLVMNTGQ